MRITNGGMMRNFNTNLGKQMEAFNSSLMQAYTSKKFQRGSEDAAAAAKTKLLYRNYQQNEIYLSNIKSGANRLDTGHALLLDMNGQIENAYGTFLGAMNGTYNEDDLQNMAQTFRVLQEQFVADLNSQYASKYLFSGAGSEEPFTLENGTLYFRGLDVSDNANAAQFKEWCGEEIVMDIGSDFDMSMCALKYLGYGTDGDGFSDNVVVLLGQIADALETPGFDHDAAQPYLDKLLGSQKTMLVNLTELGARANYLQLAQSRVENAQENLEQRIADTAYVDSEFAAYNFQAVYYSYQAALRVGSSIMTTSFIDFIT